MNLIDLAIKRPLFLTMITCLLIVVGVLAVRRLPVDLYPSVSYPVLAVRADLAGASPEEIEQLVTKPMEDALSTVAGIQTLRSQSRPGRAMVMMEFDMATDIRFQEIQVRGKIANLRARLPDTMSEPVIYRQDPDDQPIIQLVVTGPRSASELTVIADDVIGAKIRQISGVGQVDLRGERLREIKVDVSDEAVERWHLDLRTVVSAIQDFTAVAPIGRIDGEKRTWSVRNVAQVKTAADLGNIGVGRTSDGQPLYLRDVAKITDGFTDVERVTRIGTAKAIEPGVQLQIVKQSGENTVAVSDRVRKTLDDMRDVLPKDIRVSIILDNADLVRTNVADVYESLAFGALLTIFVVMVFLRSPRSTITTGVSLPSSVISTFAAMALAAFTVNVMTLLALSLAIGLLVDDAIVVRENIFRHLQTPGISPADAARKGTREVSLAVVATTLAVVAMFLPVGFMSGVTGQFFKQFALTVVFAMLISLWDAMSMAPMLSCYFANIANPADEWRMFGRVGKFIDGALVRFDHGFEVVVKRYEKTLAWSLPRPWFAGLVAAASLSLAAGGFILVKKGFLPTQLGNVFSATLQGPLAIPLDQVMKVADDAHERLKAVPQLKQWTITANGGYSGYGDIDLTLIVDPKFAKSQATLASARAALRRALADVPGYSLRVSEPADPMASGGSRFQPIAVVISGDDIGQINTISRQVRGVMTQVRGITDVARLQDEGLPEVRVKPDPALAAQYGVSSLQISQALQIWIEGDTSNSIAAHDKEVPIRVRLENGRRLSPQDMMSRNIYLKGSGGSGSLIAIPLINVAQWEAGAGPIGIGRENRTRMVRIGANLSQGAALGDVITELKSDLAQIPLPTGYSATIAGQSEQMGELFTNVIWAVSLGSLFIYMVLVALFESFLQPITVLVAIPLAATGAILALLIFGLPLDLYGGIGMILLAGIVAKNSILLVDFAMQRVRDENAPPDKAIASSAPLRLRPILMTSGAMVAGMLPVALGWGSGGAARQTLGVAAIGGVISSTILTLFVVPTVFVLFEHLGAKMARVRNKMGLFESQGS